MIKKKEKTLSHKVINSTMWLFGFQIMDNILGFVRIIVLARLLSPTAFGLVGAAWLILQIIDNFTVTGISQVLIHKQKVENYLNAAWTFTALRGIFIYLIIVLCSPLIGNFFNNQGVGPILLAISLTILINGFGNIGMIFFQKELEFQKQFKIQIIQNTTDLVVTLLFAFILHNVWAIVIGALANSITGCSLSYVFSSYRPRFEWDMKKIKEMNDYGKWIGGSNILQFLYSQGDDILVGKLLGVTALGYYQLGYKISNLPATQITHIISTVMFPAYASIQNSIEKVRSVYFSILQVTSFLSFFIGTIIICFANDFTVLFLGKQWLPILTVLQLLTIWGLIRSIGATTGPVWQALGIPNKTTMIQMIQVLIMFTIILPLTIRYGITGTSIAVVISALIPNIISIYMINKTLKSKITDFIIELGYPGIASICIAFIYYLLKISIFANANYFTFFAQAIICTLAYLLITYTMFKVFHYSIYTNIYNLIVSNKNNNKFKLAFIRVFARFI